MCGRATAQNYSDLAQNLEICMRKLFFFFFTSFLQFFLHFSHILSDFSDIFPLFLAQNLKNLVLTAQKNLLLECL